MAPGPDSAPSDVATRADQPDAACADSTRPLAVTVSDTSGELVPAGQLTGGLSGAMVEVNWFAPAASVGGTRSAVGLPQVAETDRHGVAHMCLLRRSGEPVVVAYVLRAMSAVVPLASDGSGPLAMRLGVSAPAWHPLLPAPPPVGSSQIDVRVRDASGAPVEGATIEVDGWDYTSATTNGSGRLTLSNLPEGTAIIDVWRPGYARQRLAVDLASKKTLAIEIRMATRDVK